MQCPNCDSENLIKLSLVNSEGLSNIDTRSRGHGLMLGDNGLALGFGNFTTTGAAQTRLSKFANPPHKKAYWKVILGWFLGLLLGGWLPGYLTTVTRAPEARFEEQFRWFTYVYSCLAVLALGVFWRYNHRVFPRRLQLWNRSFMCCRCGGIFQPPAPEEES